MAESAAASADSGPRGLDTVAPPRRGDQERGTAFGATDPEIPLSPAPLVSALNLLQGGEENQTATEMVADDESDTLANGMQGVGPHDAGGLGPDMVHVMPAELPGQNYTRASLSELLPHAGVECVTCQSVLEELEILRKTNMVLMEELELMGERKRLLNERCAANARTILGL